MPTAEAAMSCTRHVRSIPAAICMVKHIYLRLPPGDKLRVKQASLEGHRSPRHSLTAYSAPPNPGKITLLVVALFYLDFAYNQPNVDLVTRLTLV